MDDDEDPGEGADDGGAPEAHVCRPDEHEGGVLEAVGEGVCD